MIIDREAALNLIDELRVAVPEEVRAAKRINSEGERIIDKSQEEAERIIARAQEQAAFLIEDRGLTLAAEEDSRRIIDEARQDADDVRRGADEYAAAVLEGLQSDVEKTLRSIEKGIGMLDDRRAALRSTATPPPLDATDGYGANGHDYGEPRYDRSWPSTTSDEEEGASQPVGR